MSKGGPSAIASLSKHFEADRSLQRGTEQREAGGRVFNAARDDRFADEFFKQQQHQHGPAAAPFRMDELYGELDRIRFEPQQQPRRADWAEEFEHMGPMPHHQHQHAHQHMEDLEQYYNEPGSSSASSARWHEEFLRQPDAMRPLDPREFAELEQFYHHRPAPATAKVTELTEEEWAAEFDGRTAEPVLQQQDDPLLGDGEDEDQEEYLRNLESMWAKANEHLHDDENMSFPFGERRFDELPYEFEPVNPFLTHPTSFDEGMRLMERGNLSDAALAFEAAVQQDEENAAAWVQLGQVQAENEKEDAAIRALQRAVKLDPKNMQASLALAVSYTNENAESQAYDALENWIRVRYPDLPPAERARKTERHQQVVDLYLNAARRSPELDADVQVGLGVLFNISAEYQKATDCFQAALAVRPNDYLLWNRLGATLANGGRSEEAIDAYYQALERKPSFVRARYNLGVSCINIGCLKEAAEHFLGALALHGNGTQRNVSNNLWDTLRRTFIMMDRQDLVKLAAQQDVNVFRGEFDF